MKKIEMFNSELNKLKKLTMKKPITSGDIIVGVLLFKDYMARMREWYTFLKLEWDFNITKRKDGHNLFNYIDTEIGYDLPSLEDFRLNYLNDTEFGLNEIRSFDYFFIYLYIKWKIYSNEEESFNYDHLPLPYASVILILNKNLHITYRNTFFNISGIDIRKKEEDLNFRLPSIDSDFLEFLSEKTILVGTLGIPNQDKVNELWEEFNCKNH